MQTVKLPEGPLPCATSDWEQVKSDVREFGYGIAKDVLSPDLVKAMRAALTREIDKDERAGKIKESYTDRDAVNRRLAILADRDPLFRDLVDHPLALEMSRSILGDTYLDEPYLLHGLSANVTRPGSREMGIHGDTDYILPYSDKPLFARIIWFLDDFDEEVGATRVVPKSHLFGGLPVKDGSVTYETVPALGSAGSALVYDGRLFHGTGVNRSKDRERAGVVAGYIHPWMRPSANFPMVLDPAMIEGASEVCRQLLGYGTVNIGFDQPWTRARDDVAALTVSRLREVSSMRHQVRKDHELQSAK